MARNASARLLLLVAIPFGLLSPSHPAAAGTSTKKQIKELNAQIQTLTQQLSQLAQQVQQVSADTTAIRAEVAQVNDGIGRKLLADSSLQLCAEFAVEGEVEFAASAEADAGGDGSLGAEAVGNGAKVQARAEGKGGAKWAVKGTGALPKLVYCFDVARAAEQILDARAAGAATRTAATPPTFDPTRLSPAAQDYVVSLAQADPVDLADRMGGVAQFAGLTTTALSDAFGAVALADGRVQPLQILNGDGPLLDLAASLPLPPGVRQTVQDPSRVTAALTDFHPCDLTDLEPGLQGVVDGACAARPDWDPAAVAEQFGGIGDLVSNVESILQKSTAIQSVVGATRTLMVRVCNAVDNIPGVNPNCSI